MFYPKHTETHFKSQTAKIWGIHSALYSYTSAKLKTLSKYEPYQMLLRDFTNFHTNNGFKSQTFKTRREDYIEGFGLLIKLIEN